mmetsp:Transcript_636/g.861  ORF Transcript_636/g.861 Transcript_636/m.861 type:complete len:133 (-) Transcript_636:56-454(-)
MYANTTVWGPMFLMGLFGLSEKFRGQNALYIEHVISNAMIPALLYAEYMILAAAIDTGKWTDYLKLGLFSLYNLTIYGIMLIDGQAAIYYLYDFESEWADTELIPSLFYLLGWTEHTPRYPTEDDFYGEGNY